MIADTIIALFLGITNVLISALPVIAFTMPVDIVTGFAKMIGMSTLILPYGDVLAILGISLSVTLLTIVWSTILRIIKFIPTMSG